MFQDSGLIKPHRKSAGTDLNLTPILDVLFVIIFFLLRAVSFDEYNKVTLPPAQNKTISDPQIPPPLNPKLVLIDSKEKKAPYLFLSWAGAEADVMDEKVDDLSNREALKNQIRKMLKEFKNRFPAETTIQLGVSGDLSYQTFIDLMDSGRAEIPNVAVISYLEAESFDLFLKTEKSGGE